MNAFFLEPLHVDEVNSQMFISRRSVWSTLVISAFNSPKPSRKSEEIHPNARPRLLLNIATTHNTISIARKCRSRLVLLTWIGPHFPSSSPHTRSSRRDISLKDQSTYIMHEFDLERALVVELKAHFLPSKYLYVSLTQPPAQAFQSPRITLSRASFCNMISPSYVCTCLLENKQSNSRTLTEITSCETDFTCRCDSHLFSLRVLTHRNHKICKDHFRYTWCAC